MITSDFSILMFNCYIPVNSHGIPGELSHENDMLSSYVKSSPSVVSIGNRAATRAISATSENRTDINP